jgi:alkanesulfonate monooxygenase SsuD/methylene tetrahydromethanopterin reductase-like flavin-dependent oxidoreductase (luciferase family)
MDFMAKHGIQGMVGGGSAEGGAMHRVVLAWQEAQARVGRHLELGAGLCFGFHFYIANSREQGMREAAKYYEENMKMFGPLRLVRALTDEQIDIMADPSQAPHAKLPRIEDAVNSGGFLCGSPEQIIEHLKKLEQSYPGLERVSVSLSVGVPQAVAVEQLERFGTEVMPAFTNVAAEPALAD